MRPLKEEMNKIADLVTPIFKEFGFSYNKRKKAFMKNDGEFVFHFSIDLKKNPKGYFNHHAQLKVQHSEIISIFRNALKKTIKDDRFDYPLPITDKVISTFTKDNYVAYLTDWGTLLSKEGIKDNGLWVEVFEDIEEVEGWGRKYTELVEASVFWFEKCKELDYLLKYNIDKFSTHSLEIALAIMKFEGFDNQKISNKLSIWLEKKSPSLDKDQLRLFLEYLLK